MAVAAYPSSYVECSFRLVETQSVQDPLDGVAKRTFDAGVAAVTVTAARARNIRPFDTVASTMLGRIESLVGHPHDLGQVGFSAA
jgi:hypothetical protein